MRRIIGIFGAAFISTGIYLSISKNTDNAGSTTAQNPVGGVSNQSDSTSLESPSTGERTAPEAHKEDPSEYAASPAFQETIDYYIPSEDELNEFIKYNPEFASLVRDRVSWLKGLKEDGVSQLEIELGEMSPRTVLLSLQFAVANNDPELLYQSGIQLYSMLGPYEGKVELAERLASYFAELDEWERALQWRYIFLREQACQYSWEIDPAFIIEDATTSTLALEGSPGKEYISDIEMELLEGVTLIENDIEDYRATLPVKVEGISLDQVGFTAELDELVNDPEWWKKAS